MLNLTPPQNRVEERSTPTSRPPCSQTSPPPPPGSQAFTSNDETHFFTNNIYKKLYQSTVKCIEKLVKCDSRIWFLNQCLKLKLLPNNSKVKTGVTKSFSITTQNQIDENLFNVGLQNLKLGLKEEQRSLVSFKFDLRSAKIELHKVIIEPNLHIFIEDRILKDKARILKQVKNKHRQKLCFLLERRALLILRPVSCGNFV